MSKNVLHVFSVPFSINYFVGEQFKYLKKLKNYNYFVSCSDSEEFRSLSQKLSFNPQPVEIRRKISPLSDLKAIFSLIKVIKKNKIDKVVGHSPKGAMIAMIAATISKVPNKIYFRHGVFFETSKGLERLLLKNVDRLSGSLADKVVCVSNAVKNISEKEKLNYSRKNIVLGLGTCNGVDVEGKFNPANFNEKDVENLKNSLRITSKDFVVGFVGRLVKDKGINELVDAWEIFHVKYPQSKLLLLGPIEERDALPNSTLKKIEQDESVIACGNVNSTAIYYNIFDVFVLPTYREGFPTVVLEASAMELPIIITRATGCEEAVIENQTGIFTSHNPTDIASKLEYLFNNKELGIQLGKNGRKFIKDNFDQQKIWDIINKNLDI